MDKEKRDKEMNEQDECPIEPLKHIKVTLKICDKKGCEYKTTCPTYMFLFSKKRRPKHIYRWCYKCKFQRGEKCEVCLKLTLYNIGEIEQPKEYEEKQKEEK